MAKSGMDYGKMTSLIRETEQTYAPAIHSVLTGSIEEIHNDLTQAYSGTAADDYKAKFLATASDVDTTMASIINKMKDNFAAERTAYAEQEKKMVDSLITDDNKNKANEGN